MEKPIQSFQDLSLQTDMLYGTVEKTSIHDYLKLKSDEDESSQKGSQYTILDLKFPSLYLILLLQCQTRLGSWPGDLAVRVWRQDKYGICKWIFSSKTFENLI